MRAQLLRRTVSLREVSTPLELVDLPTPQPGPGELRIKVAACGVCHTELDEIEGRTAPPRLPIIPGHEIVGYVDKLGELVTAYHIGDRVGVGWIHCSSGDERENVSPEFRATGRDVNGGYAEFITVSEDYAYPIPGCFSDVEAAPLLCAGAIGYRAMRLSGIVNGQTLGLTGFGGSAHLVLQMVRHRFPETKVFVFARDPDQQAFALGLGADWAGHTTDKAPVSLDAIIDTTPAWQPVVSALANLAPGGRLVINAIRKEDEDRKSLLELSYDKHLWMEKEVKTVANITQFDIREFLPLAADIPLRSTITRYPLEDANTAIMELKMGSVRGSKVLVMDA